MGARVDYFNDLGNWQSVFPDVESFRAAHERYVALLERRHVEISAELRHKATHPEPPI